MSTPAAPFSSSTGVVTTLLSSLSLPITVMEAGASSIFSFSFETETTTWFSEISLEAISVFNL